MAAKYQIDRAVDGSFYFRLVAANGEIILASEMYTTKGAAENGIDSVKANSQVDERFERLTDSDGKPYFVLKAANNQIIGKSQIYAASADLEIGTAAVKADGANSPVEDLTKV
jgi:hypothetical protein